MKKILCFCLICILGMVLPHTLGMCGPHQAKTKASLKKSAVKKTPSDSDKTVATSQEPVLKAEFPSSVGVPEIEVKAKQAILVDDQTGTVLLQKQADTPMHPSSMTKIMTAYLVLKKIKEGIIQPDTLLTVGKEGWRAEGSSMFLNVNDQVSVLDLLKGVIIQSGNDASIVLAQGLSGSEPVFASEMTQVAHEMGAVHTCFKNAPGLPHPEHLTTARDLIMIAQHAIHDHPEYYSLYSEKSFTYGGITQGNRNPLLYKNMGCDGIKTGHSEIAGYGMVASCVNQGQRFLLVINGLPSMQARADEATRIMTWAMNMFCHETVFKAQQLIDQIPVWYGHENLLPLTVEKDVVVTLPCSRRKDLKVKITYEAPIAAPIQRGTVVGKVTVISPALPNPVEFPLVAAITIEKAGFFKRLQDSFLYLLWGVPHENDLLKAVKAS